MRIESKIKFKVGKETIGGPYPLICLPLVAKNLAELEQEAAQIVSLSPDMIEWRVDHFSGYEDLNTTLSALTALRKKIGTIPLLFTCRNVSEGGCCDLSPDQLLKLNLTAAASKQIDLLDTEVSNGIDLIAPIKEQCLRSEAKLVLSYHNFNDTPEKKNIIDRLRMAQDLGGDIAKIAVMPNHPGDVLTLLNATHTARIQKVDIPIITISMGQLGAMSRIVGGFFGSDVTFAVGRKSSAPGQIPIEDLRLHWRMLSIKK